MEDYDSNRSWTIGEGISYIELGQRKRESGRTIEGWVIVDNVGFWYGSHIYHGFFCYRDLDSVGKHGYLGNNYFISV